ncbi:sulfotransferase family protein [Amaricoccus solimangrovi]|uniref:Sulfotransferase n=1 Tax=Amaricoccus solimangrovi TaxID=2589815 RepID=A0A501WQ31_9RHOB|nr:sulfotransferase [Amaricoccus solimangrovi]TPE49121.1 sulfotransferase [Amaricoccus solimangrovi]
MIPNFFIIGAPKCGTSALAQYLSEHPAVFFTDPKEPFYFSEDYPKLKKQHFLTDDASYLALYANADPERHIALGEGSTNYLASEVAVARALRMSPDAKFIVLLRDPVEVAHAFHMEQVFARNEDEEDFERAWRLQDARARGESIPATCLAPQFLLYREVASYAGQIERFFAQVPPERRLVLFQEQLKADPLGLYRESLAFLGLPDDGRAEFPIVNGSHSHRYEWLANLVLRPPKPLQPAVWAFRNYARRNKPRSIELLKERLRVKSRRKDMSPAFEAELYEVFRPDVERLERLLEVSLPKWKGPHLERALEASGLSAST